MTEPNDSSTVGNWAARIKAEVGKTVDSVLAIGHLLIAAKAALDHGMFEALFFDLPFDIRMGEMYMRIASNEVLANPKHVSLLPSAMSTLYILSRIEPLRLEQAIADGSIHPRLQRKEARTLFALATPAIEVMWSLADADERLRQVIKNWITNAPLDNRKQIIAQIITLLENLADELKQGQDPDLQADVQAAFDDLGVHDSEPGAYRLFQNGAVIGGVKSTHASWYRDLTTKVDGATALDREIIERRLKDFEAMCPKTRRTAFSYEAVLMAIRGLGRRFNLGYVYGRELS